MLFGKPAAKEKPLDDHDKRMVAALATLGVEVTGGQYQAAIAQVAQQESDLAKETRKRNWGSVVRTAQGVQKAAVTLAQEVPGAVGKAVQAGKNTAAANQPPVEGEPATKPAAEDQSQEGKSEPTEQETSH